MIVRRRVANAALRWTDEVADLAAHANLVRELVHRDLTIRYKRSLFGFFWTMLHPLLMMLMFTLVFAHLFRRETPRYEIYFLSAFIAWNFFAQTATNAMASVAWNGPLMKRVRVPRSIFPLSAMLSGLINLVLALLALLVMMVAVGAPIRPSIAFVPVSFAILGIFTLGVSLVLTAVAVYFADVREMVQAALPALLYLAPIIYPASIVPEHMRWIVEANPLTLLIELVRTPIYDGRLPSAERIGAAFALALLSLLAGWAIFRRLAPRFESRL